MVLSIVLLPKFESEASNHDGCDSVNDCKSKYLKDYNLTHAELQLVYDECKEIAAGHQIRRTTLTMPGHFPNRSSNILALSADGIETQDTGSVTAVVSHAALKETTTTK